MNRRGFTRVVVILGVIFTTCHRSQRSDVPTDGDTPLENWPVFEVQKPREAVVRYHLDASPPARALCVSFRHSELPYAFEDFSHLPEPPFDDPPSRFLAVFDGSQPKVRPDYECRGEPVEDLPLPCG